MRYEVIQLVVLDVSKSASGANIKVGAGVVVVACFTSLFQFHFHDCVINIWNYPNVSSTIHVQLQLVFVSDLVTVK